MPHSQRPQHQERHPVHVTLRVEKSLGQLRTKLKLRALKAALRRARARRKAFRIIHFSLMSTHVHLIVEAADKEQLTNGMRALEISIAHRFNQIVGRKGAVIADRYHARPLKTPKEVRAALAYVLLNSRHHATPSRAAFIDPCSSGRAFDGWSRRCALPPGYIDDDAELGPSTAAPGQWLLKLGWKRHHPLISPDEVPGKR